MYGYRHGLLSSHKLHQACQVNVELWWLLKGLKPSPQNILCFRKNNAPALKKALQHFVLLLKEWQLIDGGTKTKLISFYNAAVAFRELLGDTVNHLRHETHAKVQALGCHLKGIGS